jgi:hypothetical protein
VAEQEVSLEDLGFAGVAGVSSDRDVLAELLAGTDDPVAEQREKIDDSDAASLAENFRTVAALTKRKAELEEQLDRVSKALTAAKWRQLEMMETQGTTQFRDSSGQGSCFVQERFDTEVTDPDAFQAWADERHPELFSINSQTRNKFIRENYRDKGVAPDSPDFPPGIKVSPQKQLAVRGARPKKEKQDNG